MLVRELEPEWMDDPDESRAYDNMDHVAVNAAFVQDLLATGMLDAGPVDPQSDDSIVLDLGTGTALIPIELCRQFSSCRIVASDAAISMLEIGRLNVAVATCEHRIELHHGDAKRLDFFDDLFDGVMSNSLLHHLPDPVRGLAEMLRVCKPGGWLFIRDLTRPPSLTEVEALVAKYASDEPSKGRELFRRSLLAALTLEEARQMAESLGLPADSVQSTSDRHWTLSIKK